MHIQKKEKVKVYIYIYIYSLVDFDRETFLYNSL